MIKLSGFVNLKTEAESNKSATETQLFRRRFEQGLSQMRNVEDSFDAASRIPDISIKSNSKLINRAFDAKDAVAALRQKLSFPKLNEAAGD